MSKPGCSHRFVVPPLDGPITGGTLFNRELIRALRELGQDVHLSNSMPSKSEIASGASVWVDSLFIDEFPSIVAACGDGQSVGLIVHYLPSLLERPTLTRAQLTSRECAALDAADRFLATSDHMAAVLRALTVGSRPILVVEPGCFALGRAPMATASDCVRAVMVANIVPNKGISPFLQALGSRVRESDRFALKIVGNRELAPNYAEQCVKLVATTPLLERGVELLGEQPPARVVEVLQGCDVMISSSTMESYGMALAEARTLGIPLLAIGGGNVRSWISHEAGGTLVSSHAELASAFLELCQSPSRLRACAAAARRNAIEPRCWRTTAEEYLRLVSAWELGGREIEA